MYNLVSNMLSSGDISPLKQAMLHSSYWAQGGAKIYTQTQQSQCWLNWFANVGMISLELIDKVEHADRTWVFAYGQLDKNRHGFPTHCQQNLLELDSLPKQQSAKFLIGFDIRHNSLNIKSVHMNTDPNQLAQVLSQEPATLKKWWPKSDPLVLCDIDHQIHPHTTHASPSSLLLKDRQADEATAKCLDKWWQIHQQGLLGEIFSCYATNAAIVQSEQAEPLSLSGYFNDLTLHSVGVNRAYSQLVDLSVSDNSAFIEWRIEADAENEKFRQSFFTLLKMAKGKVTHQYTIKNG
jgi:hypothetical protein